jgi:hypothetical protein
MSRVIRTQAAHRDRSKVLRLMATALRAASGPLRPAEEWDLPAFLERCLEELAESVDSSAAAWEKRGYWVKADRFRQEWAWTTSLGSTLSDALDNPDLEKARAVGLEIATRLKGVRPLSSLSASRPWLGSRERRNGNPHRP